MVLNLEDMEPGRIVLDIPASLPANKTSTKVKRAVKVLKHTPEASVEFSCMITRAKYDSKDAECNAYCVVFVGYILDEELPEEIRQEIKRAQEQEQK